MTHPEDPAKNPWQAPGGGSGPGEGQPLPRHGTPLPGKGTPLPGHPSPGPGPAPHQQPPAPPQQPGGQQPWQGAPAGAQPGPGRFGAEGYIALTLQGNAMTSNMITPKVQIDGHPVPASYGSNHLPVPAGRHTISAEATWIVKYGQASYDVEVQPGQTVPVFYAAPMVQFMKGRMGPTKQKRPGASAFVILIAVIVVIVVIAVIAGS